MTKPEIINNHVQLLSLNQKLEEKQLEHEELMSQWKEKSIELEELGNIN